MAMFSQTDRDSDDRTRDGWQVTTLMVNYGQFDQSLGYGPGLKPNREANDYIDDTGERKQHFQHFSPFTLFQTSPLRSHDPYNVS